MVTDYFQNIKHTHFCAFFVDESTGEKANAEARCEARAEAAARRGEEKAARDAETRRFVAEQLARRTAETKIEADKREKRLGELKAKREKQEVKFQAVVASAPSEAATKDGASSYSFKPFKLFDVKGEVLAAARLGDLLADLSQEKALRIKLREEIDLQVERERAEAEHHRNLDDDEKKRRKRVQVRRGTTGREKKGCGFFLLVLYSFSAQIRAPPRNDPV